MSKRNIVRFCKLPGQPPAKFISKISWNTELANNAQLIANKCNMKAGDGVVVKLNSDKKVSQYNGEGTSVRSLVEPWFLEHKNYNYNENKCNGECKHYKQIVSADTEEIGCAVKKCSSKQIFVCNYYPGIQDKKRPYEKGTKDSCIRK
uniref:SCP domain-containing protein n=1 Tax=Trichobilharzia regenti TaxID=157069 RepID=A0AA85IUT9_TRIRE|nr:unnamed protein product [Trichobilharzia regenti]